MPAIRIPVRFPVETKLKARALFDAANSLHSFTSNTILRDIIGRLERELFFIRSYRGNSRWLIKQQRSQIVECAAHVTNKNNIKLALGISWMCCLKILKRNTINYFGAHCDCCNTHSAFSFWRWKRECYVFPTSEIYINRGQDNCTIMLRALKSRVVRDKGTDRGLISSVF